MTQVSIPAINQEDWQAQLEWFRGSHGVCSRLIDGHRWEYISCGTGDRALLLLPGGLAVAETAFRYISHFERRFRIIAPTYPDTYTTMRDVVAGLIALLAAEQISLVNIVGGSYSGLVAQALARQAPQLVDHLVLSDTGVARRERIWQSRIYYHVLGTLPMEIVRLLLRCGVGIFLRGMSQNRAFWWRYFNRLIDTMPRQVCLSHLEVWMDFDRSGETDQPWQWPTLILEAEHDGLFRRQEQLALRKLYPAARVHTFVDRPHCASLACMDDYIAIIDAFLHAEDAQ